MARFRALRNLAELSYRNSQAFQALRSRKRFEKSAAVAWRVRPPGIKTGDDCRRLPPKLFVKAGRRHAAGFQLDERRAHAKVKHSMIATAMITQFGVDPPSADGPNNHSPMALLRAMNKLFGCDNKPRA